jgi:argininosuccinate lyase
MAKGRPATNILVNNFTVGKDLDFDERLAKYDVKGSMAHCKMLAETGIISQEESEQMLSVLNDILQN